MLLDFANSELPESDRAVAMIETYKSRIKLDPTDRKFALYFTDLVYDIGDRAFESYEYQIGAALKRLAFKIKADFGFTYKRFHWSDEQGGGGVND